MKTESRTNTPGWILARVLGLAFVAASAIHSGRAADTPVARGSTVADGTIPITTLRGRVVCLPEEMHRLGQAELKLPARHEHVWAFRGTNGSLHTIRRGRFSEAIFVDDRIRAKELEIRAQVFPDSRSLEVLTIRSIKDGVVQDLYYYCDVCAIKSVSPEVCACCQAEVVLTEKPLAEGSE